MKNEIWKPVKEFEGEYEVSNLGRIKSLKNNKQRVLKITPHQDYRSKVLIWSISKKQKVRYARVCRLVAEAFLEKPTKEQTCVDHINLNKIDDRAENLRWATYSQNRQNSKARNPTGYKGVTFIKEKNKWRATISYDKIKVQLGEFRVLEDAALAYNKAAIKYHGEFAYLNKVSLLARK